MANSPASAPPDRSQLLLDFPIRFYTALRTIRLYPPTNPQVQRSNTLVLQSFQALLNSGDDEAIVLAVSDQKLMVCGEHLSDRDQAKPQIQGLINLFSRSKMHSLSFSPSFSAEECMLMSQTLSSLLGEKEPSENVAALLDRAGILSVSADAKRYVAIHEGEQVVREELLGTGLNISDEELTNFVLGGKGDQATVPGVSKKLVEELLSRLSASGEGAEGSAGGSVTKEALVELLQKFSREQGPTGIPGSDATPSGLLSALDPSLLAKLVANLPEVPAGNAVLSSAIEQLSPQRLNALIAKLVAQQTVLPGAPDAAPLQTLQPESIPATLQRLIDVDPSRQAEIQRSVAQNVDARNLLLTAETTLGELPPHLLERLHQPEWSAPVLASAAQQVVASQDEPGTKIDFTAFNRMLGQYEQLLDQGQQAQVARQAGAQLASMEGVALGNILSQKFKGLFGERLYEQVISQVSDDLLDETVEHLTPKQLNRMVATLTSEVPLFIGKDGDPDFKPADGSILKRLAQTKKGPMIEKAIAHNVDARHLLANPETTIGQLPPHLLERLHQPEWSAPVLASAAQQVVTSQDEPGTKIDFTAFNRMLGQYEQLLDQGQQAQVARQAGAQLASMEGVALGNILSQKFKGLFGERLYEQMISQVSDDLLDETVEHLTPKQLNRMVATLTSEVPLFIGKDGDPDFKPADGSILKRLAQTKKGPMIEKAIAHNVDARHLLANPETTIGQLPPHLLERLHQPEWSAPVLASAAQQVVASQDEPGTKIDFTAFNRMLGQYEQLLDQGQQAQVARQAGAQLASMEGVALGNILSQKFKGLFGERLYEQVISQVSDDLLDETVEHLTPKQLNRMVATLTSEVPLFIGKDGDPDFKPADGSILKRLAQTKKGPMIEKAIAHNVDARHLLANPETTIGQLPPHLLERLHQPEWSAPVLASAAQQVVTSQDEPGTKIDFTAFNRMLGQYEQLLDQGQQAQVARQAGAQLASMEGVALGNILSQKFKGLFGERLYEQVISQVSDDLLDETVEHLTPKQLNRMVATLTSEVPLFIGKDGDPDFKPADGSILKRLAQTKKGPMIEKAIAHNVDARHLLANPETTIGQLPPHLLERLHQPEWSAPVLASAAQQVVASQDEPGTKIDFTAFNRMLGQYEQLLDQGQQAQVARQAGAQLASMEGVALGNILSQKFKGLFGERLYEQVINQVSDALLDETVEHLTPKQLNRMVATFTSDIPLHIGKDHDPDFKPADDTVLKRLARTSKGPEISQAIPRHIDAHHLLKASSHSHQFPDTLAARLHQPDWSAPILVAATRQILDQDMAEPGAPMHLANFEQLLERYSNLLSREEQLQVASQAGAEFASFEDRELGLVLVKKYKNLFGEQLYQQVIAQLSPERVERLAAQFRDLAEGRTPRPSEMHDVDVEDAYRSLMETVRSEKMRAIIELHQEQKKQKEEARKATIESSLDGLLKGEFKELENQAFIQAVPEEVRNLLLNSEVATADNLLMQLAIGLSHQQPLIRHNAFRALAATAEHLARIGDWERFTKLLPALQQGMQQQGADAAGCSQALSAIGALTGHYLGQDEYISAVETIHFLQRCTDTNAPAYLQEPAGEALSSLCTEQVLKRLLDRFLHGEEQQDTVGKILVDLGPDSAKFQLQTLFDSESRFERKRLLELIKQTGNPAVALLLEQLHRDAPWYVLRNVIRLLGDIGNPALFSRVRPFIGHSDPRVQQEVIGTALKIGGDHLKDFLLHALQNVDDSLKIRVINHVATNHDERFVRPLTDLLESTKPFLGKNKNNLQVSICRTLGAIGSRRATASLNRVVQSKNMLGLTGYADEVREAAEHALKQIHLANLNQDDTLPEQPGESPATKGAGPVTAAAESVQAAEEAIFALVREGKQGEARQQLLDLIGSTARAGDFATAERLRERIYEIDAMPLSDVIRSEEIIQQEKQGGIREEDLEIWAELTDRLGTKEFRTIYEVFTERRFKPEETIVSQGDKNDALFFINQGSVKVSHLVGERELFITSLSRGQLAGENFFTPSLWTVTLTSLTPSRLYLLPQKALAQWQDKFPGLRAKLFEYYQTYNNIGLMLKKKGLDRRKDQRFTLARKIQVQPISNLDAPIGRGFRSETADISQGGLAFLVRISRQENARLLLGRRMQVVLPVGGKIGHLNFKGLVIGVQPYRQLLGNFSVHFKFDHPLDSQDLQAILG
nr:HEAT repeat domain-containing protein [uncultured Desulfobulbus sp.]